MIKLVEKEKAVSENLSYLIQLVTSAIVFQYKMTMEGNPNTFDETWNHPKEDLQRKQHKVIQKEFWKTTKQKVWLKTSKSQMLPH